LVALPQGHLRLGSTEVRPCIGVTNYSVRMTIVFNKRILQLKLIETLFSLKLKEYSRARLSL